MKMGKIEEYLRGRGAIITESDSVNGTANFAVSMAEEGLELIRKNDVDVTSIFGATAVRKSIGDYKATSFTVLFSNGIAVSTPESA